jgi:hypothetical protein
MNKKTAIVVGAWFNTKAQKNKVTLIFNQENDLPSAGGDSSLSRMLIASSVRSAVKPLRAIWPVSEEVAKAAGINVAGLSIDAKNPTMFEKPLTGENILGFPVSIVIEETTTQEPGSNREPKINPVTNVVCTNNGQPIYRYERVVPTDDAEVNDKGGLKHTILSIDK